MCIHSLDFEIPKDFQHNNIKLLMYYTSLLDFYSTVNENNSMTITKVLVKRRVQRHFED